MAQHEVDPPVGTNRGLRALGTSRLGIVRQALMCGALNANGLAGAVPRTSLVESAGAGGVELDLTPERLVP